MAMQKGVSFNSAVFLFSCFREKTCNWTEDKALQCEGHFKLIQSFNSDKSWIFWRVKGGLRCCMQCLLQGKELVSPI